MMRMDGAGLVQNYVLAKALIRMLADPYKFLKNVAIDCHAHYRILENAITNVPNAYKCRYKKYECLANTLQMKRMCSECLPNSFDF